MGDLILTMPMVLLSVILASLIECFLVLPGHLKGSFTKMQLSQPSRFRQRFDAAFRRLREERFRPLLRRALDYPGATFCTALSAVLLASALGYLDRCDEAASTLAPFGDAVRQYFERHMEYSPPTRECILEGLSKANLA